MMLTYWWNATISNVQISDDTVLSTSAEVDDIESYSEGEDDITITYSDNSSNT